MLPPLLLTLRPPECPGGGSRCAQASQHSNTTDRLCRLPLRVEDGREERRALSSDVERRPGWMDGLWWWPEVIGEVVIIRSRE